LAETLILQALPLTTTRIFWRFGLNFLLVTPVIFLPTPPRYLALPRRAMLLPLTVRLPVKKHTLGIIFTPSYKSTSHKSSSAINISLLLQDCKDKSDLMKKGSYLKIASPQGSAIYMSLFFFASVDILYNKF
jgi:hypothetical protein